MINRWRLSRELRRARRKEFDRVLEAVGTRHRKPAAGDGDVEESGAKQGEKSGGKDGDANIAAALQRLEHLDKLVLLQSRVDGRARQLLVVLCVLVLMAVVVAAASIDVSTARIELRARATAVRLQTQTDQRVTDLLTVRDVSASGISQVDGPSELGFSGATTGFRLASRGQAIVLEPIDLSAGTWLTIERTASQRYRLTLLPPGIRGTVSIALALTGEVEAVVDGANVTAGPVVKRLPAPRQLSLSSKPGDPLVLTFSSPDESLIKALTITQMRFERLDQVADQRVPVSSLLSAELRYPDYASRVETASESDWLELSGVAGYAKGVLNDDDALAVRFTGAVSGVRVGDGPSAKSVIPSLLDRVTRYGDWITAGSVVGALLTAAFTVWTLAKG
jgi:hypothetical protein